MPGAITNPQLNPRQAWMDFHPGQNPQIYDDAIAKGYVYGGGDSWTGSGTPQNDFEKKAAAGGVPGATLNKPAVGSPMTTGLPGSNSSSSMSSASGPGGYKIDSQLGAIDQKFGEDIKQATEMEREGLAGRGMLTGMVGQASERRARAPLEAERMAAQERLGNQQQSYQNSLDFAKQQAEWQKQLAMMSGGTYSSKSPDAGLADILAGLMGGQGGAGGGVPKPGGTQPGGAAPAPAAGPTQNADGSPIRGKGESYDAYMARWNAWFNGKKKYTPTPDAGAKPGDMVDMSKLTVM